MNGKMAACLLSSYVLCAQVLGAELGNQPNRAETDFPSGGGLAVIDQRGQPRPLDGSGGGLSRADIGVFEKAGPSITNLIVTNLADVGPGTLREALSIADKGATITIPIAGRIILNSGRLNVGRDVVIQGPGMDSLMIEGVIHDTCLAIGSGVTAVVNDLTVTNGAGWEMDLRDFGGGIYNAGFLALNRCAVVKCSAPWGSGGGIYSLGSLKLFRCWIHENEAWFGGGIYDLGEAPLVLDSCTIDRNRAAIKFADCMGGGIYKTRGETWITNSTISGNTAYVGDGGGIACYETVTLVSSTIVSNICVDGAGGGIYTRSGVEADASIIAGNNTADSWDGFEEGSDIYGTLASRYPNIIQDTNGCTISAGYNYIGVDPLLGPLQFNGGMTPTHALLPGSPAIDTGDSLGRNYDQRGFARVYDVPSIPNASDGADIGAVEYCPDVFIPMEAESGALASPMTVGSDSQASQGKYIYSPSGSGSVAFSVYVPISGRYALWTRVLAVNDATDSFYVAVDGGPALVFDAAANYQTNLWQWTRLIGRYGNDTNVNLAPRLLTLLQGNHTIVFSARESYTKLDRLLITSNPNYAPIIAMEAESAALTVPMRTYSDPLASHGKYILSSGNEQGRAAFTFGVPATNQYYVWCRVLAPNDGVDSFYVAMDGGPELVFDTAQNAWSNKWQWRQLIGRTNGSPVDMMPRSFFLDQRFHTLVFRGRESGSKLDKILITSDAYLNPANTMKALPGRVFQIKTFSEPGKTNVFQGTSDIAAPIWSTIATPIADWDGFCVFEEAMTARVRFYRAFEP